MPKMCQNGGKRTKTGMFLIVFHTRGGSKILFFSNQKPKYFFSQFNLYAGVLNRKKKQILVKNAEGSGTFIEEV